MEGSILDAVGAEIVGIMCPVSLCMLLVVFLVKELQTEVTDTVLTSVASLIYSEESTDSDWTKLLGALINAGVFVLLITVVTFVLVLLFYFRCTKCLRAYTAFGAFIILAYMGGSIAVMLVQELEIPIDAISASILLYNFAIVGVLAMFFCKVPIVLTQGYLILVGTAVAFWFTSLPEWTTWVLLVAISLYDVIAVLTPGGPLNILVQLAMNRDEEIPALIYEARPVVFSETGSAQAMTPPLNASDREESESLSRPGTEGAQARLWKRRSTSRSDGTTVLGHALSNLQTPFLGNEAEDGGSVDHSLQQQDPLTNSFVGERQGGDERGQNLTPEDEHGNTELQVYDERTPLVHAAVSMQSMAPMDRSDMVRLRMEDDENQDYREATEDYEEGIGLGASGAIKLGLGDFIFYSVLVGRAALYDMTTVYACYLAIIAGLGATLGLLAVWRRALPALPISIALGVVFYFLTRLLMEPFIMQYGGNLMFI